MYKPTIFSKLKTSRSEALSFLRRIAELRKPWLFFSRSLLSQGLIKYHL